MLRHLKDLPKNVGNNILHDYQSRVLVTIATSMDTVDVTSGTRLAGFAPLTPCNERLV